MDAAEGPNGASRVLSVGRRGFSLRSNDVVLAEVTTTFLARSTVLSDTQATFQGTAQHRWELSAPDYTEELHALPAGVEQRWRFPRRPPGGGPLRVVVQLQDAEFVGSDPSGLRFAAAGGAVVTYGHGTWIDGAGTPSPVPAVFDNGQIHLVVPAAVVEDSRYPAMLDPIVSMAYPVGNVVDAPAVDDQERIQLASNGAGFLAAWVDRRAGRKVFVARIDAMGTVLDPVGTSLTSSVPLYSVGPENVDPAIAANGSQYLVAWWGYESSIPGNYASRITGTGAVLDAPPLALDVGGLEHPMRVCPAVGGYLVSWIGTFGLRARRLGTDGILGPIVDLPATGVANWRCSWGTSDHLFLWTHTDGSFHTIVVTAGGAVGPSRAIAPDFGGDRAGFPALAHNGTHHLAVWTVDTVSPLISMGLRAARIADDGTLMDAIARPVLAARGSYRQRSLIYDGSQFVLAWYDSGTFVVPLLPDGTSTVAAVAPVGTFGYHGGSLAAGAGTHLFAWWERRDGMDVVAARVDLATRSTFEASPYIQLQTMANSQRRPQAGFDGTNYLVAWSDSRFAAAGDGAIYAARLTPSGALLDPDAIRIRVGPDVYGPVAMGSTTGMSLLAWQERIAGSTVMRAGRVSDAGVLLDPGGFTVSTDPGSGAGAMAFDGRYFVLTWTTNSSSPRVRWAFIDTTGVARTAGAPPQGDSSDIACATGVCLLVYRRANRIRARLLGAASAAEFDVAPLSGRAGAPAVAWNGRHFVVMYSDYSASAAAVFRVSVTSTGVVGTPSRALSVTGEVALARLGSSILGLHRSSGFLIDATGTVGALFPVLPSRYDPAPRLVSNGTDQGAVVSMFVDYALGSALSGAIRTELRLIDTELSLGAACAAPAECESGHCADGVCCNTACGGGDPADCQACNSSPADSGLCTVLGATAICRPSVASCDAAEVCSGSDLTCPADVAMSDGAPCDVGLACRRPGACRSGLCEVGVVVDCPSTDPCLIGTCVEPVGCVFDPAPGCGDSGLPDTGRADSGMPDTGADGGTLDAGRPDSGALDSGRSDSAAPDSGRADSGALDSGRSDSGAPDSGRPDTGAVDGGGPRDPAGCSCHVPSGPSVPSGWLVTLVCCALSFRARRRKP